MHSGSPSSSARSSQPRGLAFGSDDDELLALRGHFQLHGAARSGHGNSGSSAAADALHAPGHSAAAMAFLARLALEFFGSALLAVVTALSAGLPALQAVTAFALLSLSDKPLVTLNPLLSIYAVAALQSSVAMEAVAVLGQALGSIAGAFLSLYIQNPLLIVVDEHQTGQHFLLEMLAAALFVYVLELTRTLLDPHGATAFTPVSYGVVTYSAVTWTRRLRASFVNPTLTLGLVLAGWVIPSTAAWLLSTVAAPVAGALVGFALAKAATLDGVERQAILRQLSVAAPALQEGVGCFFLALVLFSSGSILATLSLQLVLALACWQRSGAHFNPCVSLLVALRRGKPIALAAVYVAAQLLGYALAAWLVLALPHDNLEYRIALADAPNWSAGWLVVQAAAAIAYFLVFLKAEAETSAMIFPLAASTTAFLSRVFTGVAALVGFCGVLPDLGYLLNPGIVLAHVATVHWHASRLLIQLGVLAASAVAAAVFAHNFADKFRVPDPYTAVPAPGL